MSWAFTLYINWSYGATLNKPIFLANSFLSFTEGNSSSRPILYQHQPFSFSFFLFFSFFKDFTYFLVRISQNLTNISTTAVFPLSMASAIKRLQKPSSKSGWPAELCPCSDLLSSRQTTPLAPFLTASLRQSRLFFCSSIACGSDVGFYVSGNHLFTGYGVHMLRMKRNLRA